MNLGQSLGQQGLWRRPLPEDIRRGTVVRRAGDHNVFNDAVIIKIEGDVVTLARPMAWAHAEYDCNQPMLMAEVYTVFTSSLMESFVVLPYSRGSGVTTFTT